MKPKIAKILKELRAAHNKTQKDVAAFLGITRQAYSRYESSIREPDLTTLAKIAELYDISPQVFFMDDMDQLLDAKMDIVELLARYQYKKQVAKPQVDNEDEVDALSSYSKKQDEREVRLALEQYFGFTAQSSKTTSLKRRIVTYGFLFLIVLFAVNIGIMTLHQLDSDYQYRILNHSYINAITPDQNISATMYLDIVRISEFNGNTIEVGDEIVIYQDFGLNEYFVEKVTSIDMDNQTITTTYDDATAITNRFIDVLGVYEKEANLLGTIYYSSKFSTGYMFLVIGHVILLAMYYLSFIDIKK